MSAEPQERATRDGSVYGQDCLNAAIPKNETITFTRMYRHRVKMLANTQPNTVAGNAKETGAWVVLPIQNAWPAALKPTDLVGLGNLSQKFKITSYSVECSNFNAQELTPATNLVASATIPNLFLECYVDIDRDLPGYEVDFLNEYATNYCYSTGDASNGDGDYDLRAWKWRNSTGAAINPQTNLNLYNGRGMKFIKQTDDFRFVWDVKNPQWRHFFTPWQYQSNYGHCSLYDDNIGPNAVSAGMWLPNMTWGGFPGGRSGVSELGGDSEYTAKAEGIHTSLWNVGQIKVAQQATAERINKDESMWSAHSMDGRSFPQGLSWLADDGKYYRRYNYHEGSARHQITGLPMENDPPPLILLRCNLRQESKTLVWEFFCKYTITVEYSRNQFRYDPLPIDANMVTTSWAGTGNLGMVSLPGAPYNNRHDPRCRTLPFESPGTYAVESPAVATYKYFQTSDATPAANTRSKTAAKKKTLDTMEV